ncbi:MAG: RluA family pseudouridine synthase [Hyphomicrobiales bacterium]
MEKPGPDPQHANSADWLSQPPPPVNYTPPVKPYLPVLHADEHVLVIDKPSGLLSVPGKDPAHFECVESRAQEAYPEAAIVHRLDKDTSGVMVLALNRNAQRHLGLQFERRKVKKRYIAKVWRNIAGDEGQVDLPLICDWPNRPRQMVDHERGKKSSTSWRVLAREENASLVELTPRTGRSHQLRVHMLALGHPILGDMLYAHSDALAAADRLQLHSTELILHHPDGGKLQTFSSPCPFS